MSKLERFTSAAVSNRLKSVTEKSRLLGACVVIVPNEELGMQVRKDRELKYQEHLKSILDESLRLGAVETIKAGEYELICASSANPSPHTIYAVPYDEFADKWRGVIASNPQFQGNKGEAHFLQGKGGFSSIPEYVPLHLITWGLLKKGDNFEVFDIYDLAGREEGNVSRPKLQTMLGLDDDQFIEVRRMFLKIFAKRLEIHSEFLNSVYNSVVLPHINEKLNEHEIQLDRKDPGDIVHTMGVGFNRGVYDQDGLFSPMFEIDGSGGGPQSHPGFHTMTVVYPDLDRIRKAIAEKVFIHESADAKDLSKIFAKKIIGPDKIFKVASLVAEGSLKIDDADFNERLAEILGLSTEVIAQRLEEAGWWGIYHQTNVIAVENALKKGVEEVRTFIKKFEETLQSTEKYVLGQIKFLSPSELSPELVFKQVDPYGSLFFNYFKPWISGQLKSGLAGRSDEVMEYDEFRHETELHRFDMRCAEGWKFTIKGKTLSEIQEALLPFFHTMESFWHDARSVWEYWKLYNLKEKLEFRKAMNKLQNSFRVSKDTIDRMKINIPTEAEKMMRKFQEKYQLPDSAINILKRVIPSEAQIDLWLSQIEGDSEMEDVEQRLNRWKGIIHKSAQNAVGIIIDPSVDPAERASHFGIFQLGKNVDLSSLTDEEWLLFQQGYNIPGVPGFAVTFEEKGDKEYTIYISPVLSKKGVAEQAVGSPIIRTTAIA